MVRTIFRTGRDVLEMVFGGGATRFAERVDMRQSDVAAV